MDNLLSKIYRLPFFSRGHHTVFSLYFLFFNAFFLQYILIDALSGNCDTWVGIAVGNSILLKLKAMLMGTTVGVSMYPATNILNYGECSPVSSFFFIFWRAIGLSSIHTSNFIQATGLSLSAFATYLISYTYTKNRWASFFAGFAFTCSNFTIANFDEGIYLFYVFPGMTLYFLKKFEQEQQKRSLLYAFLICGFCIYTSMYIFIFNILVIALFIIFKFNKLNIRDNYKTILLYFFISIILAPSPLLYFYIYSYLTADVVNIWAQFNLLDQGNFNLKFTDFTRILPGNLLYPTPDNFNLADYWPQLRKSAFIGNLVVILFFTGLITSFKKVYELFLIGLTMLIIAFGTYIQLGDIKITMPMGYMFKLFPFSTFFRVPFRAYFVTSMIISIIAVFGIVFIINKLKKLKYNKILIPLFLVSIITIHFFENVNFPPLSYKYGEYQNAPKGYLKFFENMKGKVILDLPSHYGAEFIDSHKPIFAYTRESIYMSWQTEHEQNILGGVNGHFPRSRIDLQRHISRVPALKALKALTKVGVEYIVFHPKMITKLPGEDEILDKLYASEHLEKQFNDGEVIIFRVKEIKKKPPVKRRLRRNM